MLEDVARTTQLARAGGPVSSLPQDTIGRLYVRYQSKYGQRGNEE